MSQAEADVATPQLITATPPAIEELRRLKVLEPAEAEAAAQ